MGFFDSLKTGLGGIGQGIGSVLNSPAVGQFALGFGSQLVNQLFNNGSSQNTVGMAQQPFFGPPAGFQQQGQRFAVLPGGAPVATPFNPSTGGGFMPAFPNNPLQVSQANFGFDIPGFDLVNPIQPQGMGQFSGGGLIGPGPIRQTQCGVRAAPFAMVVNGKQHHFKPAGRPILWSSDLSACKRVSKVARRARRARPR